MLTMVKNKKTTPAYDKTTIIFGYALFALTIVSFLISTAIPFSFSFQYPGARHFNIAVMVVSFAIATFLPILAAYFIGDRATHAKNKTLHHYNGILFGVAAHWSTVLFSWIGFSSILGLGDNAFPASLVVSNVVPVVLTILLMAALAIAYTHKQKNNTSVLQYKPYQMILISSVVFATVYPYFSGFFDAGLLAIITTISLPIIATAIAYKVLAKFQSTRLARLSDAIIAMSMGWIAIWLANSLISLSQLPYQLANILGYVSGLIVFVVYLYLRLRKSR